MKKYRITLTVHTTYKAEAYLKEGANVEDFSIDEVIHFPDCVPEGLEGIERRFDLNSDDICMIDSDYLDMETYDYDLEEIDE